MVLVLELEVSDDGWMVFYCYHTLVTVAIQGGFKQKRGLSDEKPMLDITHPSCHTSDSLACPVRKLL